MNSIKKQMGKVLFKGAYPFVKNSRLNLTVGVDKALLDLNKVSENPKTSCYKIDVLKKNNTYSLDIVLPAYNCETYIEDCINSVVNQKSRYKFRTIIIDDGSTDSTPDIIDRFITYDNVYIIHQENRGFSGARNVGLELLESDYVMFVDSDDILSAGAIDKLLTRAYDLNADIVEGGYLQIDNQGKMIKEYPGVDGALDNIGYLRGQPWGKVIRSHYFKNTCFPEQYWYEDSIFRQIIYPQIKSIGGIRDCVYNYRINSQGITISGRRKVKCLDSLYIFMQLFEDRKKYGLSITQDYYEYALRQVELIGRRTIFMDLDIKKKIFFVVADFIRNNFKNYRTEVDRCKYIEEAIFNNNFWEYYMAIICLR